MSFTLHSGGVADAEEAAAWVARLAADDVAPADLEAFAAWLEGAPGRAAAYDAAVAVWSLPVEAAAARPRPRRRPSATPWIAGLATAAAAVLAVGVFFAAPGTQRYVSAPGEHRDLTLKDGTRVALNAASSLDVRFTGAERSVRLNQGEAAFDVTHDARRAFVIRSGERSIRVVGTAFDVKARGGDFEVAVSRGVVEVRGGPDAAPVRLLRGDKLRFAAVKSSAVVSKVDPDEAASWRQGRLIYHDADLAEVVQALNIQFGPPAIRVTPAAGRLKFSGVLVLDGRDAVLRRLTYALPVTARATSAGQELDLAAAARR